MGCISSDSSSPIEASRVDPTNTLNVATLNYCGIMNSPFEFYCDDYLTQLKEISRQFVEIIPKYFPEFDKKTFKWNMGKIDLKYRNRYSPMFIINAGIKQDNTFMTKEQFQKVWEKHFDDQISKIKIQFTPQQKEVTKKYDVAMFHTLLRYVYGIKQINEAVSKSTKEYIDKLTPFYNLSFLDEDRKCKKVLSNFDRIDADVFFFQQYSPNFYEEVKERGKEKGEFYIVSDESKDTAIVVKAKQFQHKPVSNDVFFEMHQIDADTIAKINWNNRSAIMIIDHYVFINAHLSSKAESNKKQCEQLKQGMKILKQKLPDFDIIVAGDINSFLESFSEEFSFFPTSPQDMTTVKKRTFTQGQFNKADKVVRQSKDKIISTLKILDGKISYITGAQPSSQNLVPTDQHPFDHFVVSACLEKRKKQ